MAIPDFQSIMLPLLVITADGKEHITGELVETLSRDLKLTTDERNELLPSGRQSRFDNRVAWATFHLRRAELLKSVGRGRYQITERGRTVLASKPQAIDVKFLKQFPEYITFMSASRQNSSSGEEHEAIGENNSQTPEELLESGYQNLRRNLAQELLARVKACSPRFFENLVVDLLVKMGYGGSRKDAGQAVGQSGDGGIDGIIKEDKLGLDAVYIQAKRWDATVGRPTVQAFAGSLEGQRARKGVLITTSQFSQDAKDYINRIEKKIVLIDGEQLAQLMIDQGVGVAEVVNYTVKRIDTDYFGED